MSGEVLFFLGFLFLVVGGIIAYAISAGVRRDEAAARTAQANQLATGLMNQAPFNPAPGRDVSIAAHVFPNGGGIVRANARDALQPPQIPAVPVLMAAPAAVLPALVPVTALVAPVPAPAPVAPAAAAAAAVPPAPAGGAPPAAAPAAPGP